MGKTVLVVDDEETVRAMMVRTLAGEGYRVLEASDGLEALEMLVAETDVSLVVTDLLMPRMGGYELAKRLAGQSRVVVLFVTAHTPSHPTELQRPFLQKPFTPLALRAEVQRLLTASPA